MEKTSTKPMKFSYLIIAAVALLTVITILVVALVLKNSDKGNDTTSDIVTDELPLTGGDTGDDPEPAFSCDEYSIGKVQVIGVTRWVCEETGWTGYSLE
jgi:hypothetical protein